MTRLAKGFAEVDNEKCKMHSFILNFSLSF